MYRRALVSIALVAVAVLTAGGAALALFGHDSVSPTSPLEQVLFEVGEAGSVVVSSDGSSLEVVDVTAADGWEHRIASMSGSTVNVVFVARDMGIDFHADLDDASVVGRIRILSAPTAVSDALDDEVGEAGPPPVTAQAPNDGDGGGMIDQQETVGLVQEPAVLEDGPATRGAGVELGIEYGKIAGDTPIIDPVLDSQPEG